MIALVTLVKGWHVGGVRHWLSQADPTPGNAFEAHYRLVSITPSRTATAAPRGG